MGKHWKFVPQFFGLLVILLAFGMVFAACSSDSGGDSGSRYENILIKGWDADRKPVEIEFSTNRVPVGGEAMTIETGDTYVIRLDGSPVSSGTVEKDRTYIKFVPSDGSPSFIGNYASANNFTLPTITRSDGTPIVKGFVLQSIGTSNSGGSGNSGSPGDSSAPVIPAVIGIGEIKETPDFLYGKGATMSVLSTYKGNGFTAPVPKWSMVSSGPFTTPAGTVFAEGVTYYAEYVLTAGSSSRFNSSVNWNKDTPSGTAKLVSAVLSKDNNTLTIVLDWGACPAVLIIDPSKIRVPIPTGTPAATVPFGPGVTLIGGAWTSEFFDVTTTPVAFGTVVTSTWVGTSTAPNAGEDLFVEYTLTAKAGAKFDPAVAALKKYESIVVDGGGTLIMDATKDTPATAPPAVSGGGDNTLKIFAYWTVPFYIVSIADFVTSPTSPFATTPIPAPTGLYAGNSLIATDWEYDVARVAAFDGTPFTADWEEGDPTVNIGGAISGVTGLAADDIVYTLLTFTADADYKFYNPATDTSTPVDYRTIPIAGGGKIISVDVSTNGASPAIDDTLEVIIQWPTIVYVPITDITGIPTTGTATVDLELTAPAVFVPDATSATQAITWTVLNSGTAGATIAASTTELSTTAAGTVIVRATVTNGVNATTDYVKDFTITIAP